MIAQSGQLYTPELLELALGLADYPLTEALPLRGDARSPSCGSRVSIGLLLDEADTIASVGVRSQACAIGQAACAIFANAVVGQNVLSIAEALSQNETWLQDDGPLPQWPGMKLLERARDYPGRHGAILLPWRAALAALQ